jgi:arginyl-tRNA--protein-N-Asp/Glu arginylyltransferase
MTFTKCPDCGACPAETRCDCDFVGIRAQRRITALKSTLRAARAENAGLREFLDCFQVYREAVEMGANRECVENEYQRTKNAADEALTALTAPTPASSEFVRGLKRAAEDRAWAAANGGEEQR